MNYSNFRIEETNNLVWRVLFTLCTMSIILFFCEEAFASTAGTSTAADNDVIGQTFCRLVETLSGGIAKGIATIAIFSVGVGLFLGKLNWGIAAATAAGVGIIFSAQNLVAFITGEAGDSECPTA